MTPRSIELLWPSGRSACPTSAGVTDPSELIEPAHIENYDVMKKTLLIAVLENWSGRRRKLIWVWPSPANAHRHKMCWKIPEKNDEKIRPVAGTSSYVVASDSIRFDSNCSFGRAFITLSRTDKPKMTAQ